MAEISKMLPGYNCGECGHRQCKDYAEEILKKGDISKCRYLELERFIDTKAEIQQFLSTHIVALDKVDDLPLELVSGYGEGINTKGFDICRYLARGLNSIRMEIDTKAARAKYQRRRSNGGKHPSYGKNLYTQSPFNNCELHS